MAYGKQRMIGRVVVLLLLVLILVIGGIVWFDYLAVIDAKPLLSPVYKLLKLEPRTQTALPPDAELSLDGERLSVRMEALELRSLELDKMEESIGQKTREVEQMAQEVEDRQKAVEEKENSFNLRVEQFENRRVNVEQNARYLVSMPPDKAVAIIAKMDDQDAIDVFRMTEELAQKEGKTSMVSVWLSRLAPERSAELQRKMAGKPRTLN